MPRTTNPAVSKKGDGIYVKYEELDVRETLRWLNKQPREINNELKDESYDIADYLRRMLYQFSLRAEAPPQAVLVAGAAKVKRDRIPIVRVGGSKLVGRPYTTRQKYKKWGKGKGSYYYQDSGGKGRKVRATAGELLWGSEYGAQKGIWRFARTHNPEGYWIRPALEACVPHALRSWHKALERAVRKAEAQ